MILYFVFNLFFIAPIIEWIIHYAIHRPPVLKFHKQHHIAFYKNKNLIEVWTIPVIMILTYFTYYLTALGFLKYLIVHNVIHYYPENLPILAKHHFKHHTDPTCNFAVSSILPDRIFNTYKESSKIKFRQL